MAQDSDQFSGTASSMGFWRSDEADTALQKGNTAAWLALADTEQERLPGARVVDIGCNSGAFLRFLIDHYAAGHGYGLDPAAGVIQKAHSLNGERPIDYVADVQPPPDWRDNDLCFSQEAIYLIPDLVRHADDVWRLLRPGGRYLAVTCVHRNSDRMAQWHAVNAEVLGLPALRGLHEYLAPFVERGFQAAVGWLPVRFVPIDPGRVASAWDSFEFWTKTSDKVLFRFTKPAEASD